MKYFERFGDYKPNNSLATNDVGVSLGAKITDFSQQTPNGMAGTLNKDSETIAPDDQLKVGYPRFLRDLKKGKKVRNWRIRRNNRLMQ